MKKKLFIIGLVLAIIIGVAYGATTWYIAGEPNSGVTATQAQSLKALAESATWTSAMWAKIAVLGGATDATVDSLVLSSTAGAAAIDQKIITVDFPDLSAADTVFIVSPYKACIVGGLTVVSHKLKTAPQKLFLAAPYSGASWDDSCTIDSSGAIGDVDTFKTFTEISDTVLASGVIAIKGDGASAALNDTTRCTITLKLRLID